MPSGRPTIQYTPSGTRIGDVPNVRFVELGLKLLTHWRFDIEHCEGTCDVKEQGPDGEPSSWTYPVKDPSRTEIPEMGHMGMRRDRTVCPFQKSYPRDLSRTDPASHLSRTAQDRTCAVQDIWFRRSIQPYASNIVSR